MFQLSSLTRLVKKRKRIGRGGSRGGTSGKGHKGQRARSSAGIRIGFEGGQMPLHRRLPKRGFTNARFAQYVVILSLNSIERAFDQGDVVSKDSLIEKGIIKTRKSKKRFKIKVLTDGKLTKKVTVIADAFSESAKKAITDAGGQARLT